MNDIDKLKGRIEYHKREIAKIQSAIEVLQSIDDVGIINTHDNQLVIPKNTSSSVPKQYDDTWTHIQRVAFFFNQIGRCAFPYEIGQQYKLHKHDIKDTMVNQVLNSMKTKGLVKSYRTVFDKKAHAWGLSEWFNDKGVIDKYKAIKPEKTLWD